MRPEGCAGPHIGGKPIPKHYGRPPLDWLIITSVLVKRSLVSVVDDDESVRESLPDLLREFGFAPRAFSSAEDFLASDCVDQTNCLILDIGMPRMSGPDLQKELKQRRKEIPIVFITAHKDETVRLRLLEQGAAECLFKPFSDTALLEALNAALRRN
jgi:FixJ family two-component response regulator